MVSRSRSNRALLPLGTADAEDPEALQKKMILIKGAGHLADATHRQEFLRDLTMYVQPLATNAGQKKIRN